MSRATTATSYESVDISVHASDVYISSHTDAVKRILAASAASTCRPAHELVSFPASMSCSAALAALHNAKIHGAPVYDTSASPGAMSEVRACWIAAAYVLCIELLVDEKADFLLML
jgi:hypothetical protein